MHFDQEIQEPPTRRSMAWLLVSLILGAEVLGISLLSLPKNYDLLRFAAEDASGNLAVLDMLDWGDRPGLDNGYPYGLLSIAFGQLWYGVLGRTPGASVAATMVANLVVGLTLGWFARVARIGIVGLVFLVAAMPFVVVDCISTTHAIEPALLSIALVEQARGCRGTALALVTAAVFVKPSMSFVYGLVLVVLILKDAWRSRSERPFGWFWLRPFVPAATVGATMLIGLGWAFGFDSLLNSLFPTRVMEAYRACDYGFFRGQAGRGLLAPPGANLGYYFGTVTTFWLIGSVILLAGGIEGLVRRGGWSSANTEIVATCAVLHAVFVSLFFAHSGSWFYYIYFFVAGLAALAPRSRVHATLIILLATLAGLGGARTGLTSLKEWRTKVRSEQTYGLYATPAVAHEWAEVRSRLGRSEAVVLSDCDGLGVFAPGFAPPRLFFLIVGMSPPGELERKRDQIETAKLVVEINHSNGHGPWLEDQWPIMRQALKDAEPVYRGLSFRLYRRPGGGDPSKAAEN
ncbi:MAG: hypothetical protein ABI353_16865 [Isosphaeraceae bacterium]